MNQRFFADRFKPFAFARGELPILMATLGTSPNPTSVVALKSRTVKTYAALRGEIGSSEVYTANVIQEAGGNVSDDEEGATVSGRIREIFALKPKRRRNHVTSPGTRKYQNAEQSRIHKAIITGGALSSLHQVWRSRTPGERLSTTVSRRIGGRRFLRITRNQQNQPPISPKIRLSGRKLRKCTRAIHTAKLMSQCQK